MGFVETTIHFTDADDLPNGEVASVVLPESVWLRRKAEEVARRAAMQGMTGALHATERRNDLSAPPAAGTTMVWPDDERDQRGERPLILYDWRPGYPPLAMVTAGAHHWRDVLDQLEEYRHYEDPMADWSGYAPADQIVQDANAWVDRILSVKNGRRQFAFHNTNGLSGSWI